MVAVRILVQGIENVGRLVGQHLAHPADPPSVVVIRHDGKRSTQIGIGKVTVAEHSVAVGQRIDDEHGECPMGIVRGALGVVPLPEVDKVAGRRVVAHLV
jgi:hypothetical protein